MAGLSVMELAPQHRRRQKRSTPIKRGDGGPGNGEQQQLWPMGRTAADDALARAECRALVDGGYGQLPDYVDWLELYGQK